MTVPRHSRGFTLIELAIVTMIVGLLVGGILKGQELVEQARAKNVINDFSGVAAAVLSYRDRYGAWAGDDNNAGGPGGRWNTFGTRSGNGDNRIGGGYHDLPTAGEANDPSTITIDGAGNGESKLFWWHLRIAGFVVGPLQGPGAANIPSTAVGGILGVQTGSGVAGFFQGFIACANDIPDRVAIATDAQLDDLRPAQGQIRALRQTASGVGPPPLASGTAVTDYLEDGSRYILCRQI